MSVRTLNGITPYDWAGYLDQRVNRTGPAPLDWVKRGGYQLVYRETPTAYFASREKAREVVDLTYTLGVTLGKSGEISGVAWDSPLFNEGISSGWKILAVNGRAYSADDLKGAITAAKTAKRPIQLQLQKGAYYRTVSLPYYGGLRYPVLEKSGAVHPAWMRCWRLCRKPVIARRAATKPSRCSMVELDCFAVGSQ
jgi:predicted metalloprotease with PDZ domain